MKDLKKIIFLILFCHATLLFSQKGRGVIPSVQNLPPQADFSWLHACLGDSTCFINQTIRGQTYTWTVSDTNSHHPNVLYNDTVSSGFCFLLPAGVYSVSLSAYNNHLVTTTKLLVIDTITKADFSFIHCSNDFINTSTCASSFYWDFGDGTNSTLAVPNHQYADTGHYDVTLIVYKGSISDTLKKTIIVDVTAFTNALFTPTVLHDTVFVHANFTGVGANYYWTWDDGTYASGQDTFHVYKDSTAAYNVSLFVINSCGPSSHADTVKIIMADTAVVDSTVHPQAPDHLNFSNTTLTIVPNPVSNGDYLEAFYNAYMDDNYLARIYDELGQKMYESYFAFQSGVNGFKINTADFSVGMYVLVLQSGNSFTRKKFYIQKK